MMGDRCTICREPLARQPIFGKAFHSRCVERVLRKLKADK